MLGDFAFDGILNLNFTALLKMYIVIEHMSYFQTTGHHVSGHSVPIKYQYSYIVGEREREPAEQVASPYLGIWALAGRRAM